MTEVMEERITGRQENRNPSKPDTSAWRRSKGKTAGLLSTDNSQSCRKPEF